MKELEVTDPECQFSGLTAVWTCGLSMRSVLVTTARWPRAVFAGLGGVRKEYATDWRLRVHAVA